MIKILYVEDDPINALVVKKLLQHDYEVEVVKSAVECIEILKTTTYRAVLLDINLENQKMAGVDLLQHIKSEQKYTAMKVVAVTAFALPEDRARFLGMGFDEYIAKPVEKSLLLEVLHKVLN